MTEENALRELIDRAAISDVLHAYATAVDTRDWTLFRSLFVDPLFLDFRTFHPSLFREMPVDELVEISMRLAAFDATQHISSNHVHRLDGDRATCVSYAQAGHFLKRDGRQYACFLHGHYTYELVRRSDGWKITRYGLEVTAELGDSQIFEWVGLR